MIDENTIQPAYTVIAGVGIPGCGKTTYLKPLAARLGMSYVNPDDVRQEITGDATDHSKEPVIWQVIHGRIAAGVAGGVVVDATYSKRRDRRELIKLCRKHHAREIIAYWFRTPLEICMQRNRSRERVVPEEALQKMYGRLEANPPGQNEGFTGIVIID